MYSYDRTAASTFEERKRKTMEEGKAKALKGMGKAREKREKAEGAFQKRKEKSKEKTKKRVLRSDNYDRRTAAPAVVEEQRDSKMDRTTKRMANRDLVKAGFGGRRKFRKIGEGLNVAFSVLAKYGIEADETLSAHNFPEDKGHYGVDIAWSNTEDPFSPISIKNSVLALQWTELKPGQVEVIGYLS